MGENRPNLRCCVSLKPSLAHREDSQNYPEHTRVSTNWDIHFSWESHFNAYSIFWTRLLHFTPVNGKEMQSASVFFFFCRLSCFSRALIRIRHVWLSGEAWLIGSRSVDWAPADPAHSHFYACLRITPSWMAGCSRAGVGGVHSSVCFLCVCARKCIKVCVCKWECVYNRKQKVCVSVWGAVWITGPHQTGTQTPLSDSQLDKDITSCCGKGQSLQ